MIEKLNDYVDKELVEEMLVYNQDLLDKLDLPIEEVAVLSKTGIPKNVSVDINFIPEAKGGLSKIESVFKGDQNPFFDKIKDNLLIAEHNNCYIVVEPGKGKVMCIDMDMQETVYTNRDLSAFFFCVVVLNKYVSELCSQNSDAYIDELFTDEIIKSIFFEMKIMDPMIDSDNSFWNILFNEIRDMRD